MGEQEYEEAKKDEFDADYLLNNAPHNPFMKSWQKRLDILKERNPRVEETPGYQRMYLGRWVEEYTNPFLKGFSYG